MKDNGELFRKTHPKIHVIVIAKNEERAIGDFFRQFHPVTRNFFVLDTGSTDGTIAAAQAAGAAVESAPFTDFAAARNMAMERFGGGADWIIMLDPDERLDVNTIGHLRETLSRTSYDILLAPLDAIYPDKSRRAFVPKAFAWRNKGDIAWVFKVHEKLIGSEKQALVVNGKIEHLIELHEDGRRQAAEGMYQTLMANEPYFIESAFKERMREKWPILDYDRMDDDRIAKIHLGPLVSVVMPTYKRGRLLRRAVQSVLEQDYVNVEVLVVGDKCPEMARAVPTDGRVRSFNLPKNHGAGGAVPRNYAIMLGAGNLIAYLDDDNAWKKNHLSSLYHALRSSGASFAMSSMEVNGKDMGFTEPKFQGIDTSCLLHYRDLVRREGWWKSREEAEHYAHDWEFVSRWVKKGEPWVATGKPTLIYNAETSGQKEFLEAQASSK